MAKFTSVILSIIFIGLVQQLEFTKQKEITLSADFISIDQIGNYYAVKGSKLMKFDQELNDLSSYSSKLYGDISLIDVSDPFRILVFNRDFNRIAFLDKSLSEIITPIQLDDLEMYNVASVCQSNNGGFWLYEQDLNQLLYFDQSLNSTKKSIQLSGLLGDNLDDRDAFLVEKNDYIYLGIKGEGILLFDSYGTYIKTFPLKEISSFQVVDNFIIYSKNKELVLYNTNSFEKENIDLPAGNCLNAKLEKDRLLIQSSDKLSVYKVLSK